MTVLADAVLKGRLHASLLVHHLRPGEESLMLLSKHSSKCVVETKLLFFFFLFCSSGRWFIRSTDTQEAGGQKPRVLSIDDYYMAEVDEERTDERGVKRKVAVMKYQHDAEMEEVCAVVLCALL